MKYGFTYDHSQGYNDFTPFYARVGDTWTKIDYTKKAEEWMKPLVRGKEIDLVEIGANWYLDDLPPMMFIKKSPNSHGFVNPRDIEELWRDQFDWVYAEMDYAVFALTIHPDVSGRPQVLLMLERMIELHQPARRRRVGDDGGRSRRLPGAPAVPGRRLSRPVCILCHQLAGEPDWTDVRDPEAAGAGRRSSPAWWAVTGSTSATAARLAVVSNRKGSAEVITGLTEVWPVAATMAGRPLDPLDEDLLERLGDG